MTGGAQKSGTFKSVQHLRFVAATLVVLVHCFEMIPKVGRGDLGAAFPLGASGVDIFFAISGFLMMVITEEREGKATDFILRRIARVAPTYWLFTLVMSAALTLAPKLFDSSSFSVQALVASLVFFPWPHPPLVGAMPVLQLGWTLNYEFLFYTLFALAMAVAFKWRGMLVATTFGLLAVTGLVLRPQTVQLEFYTDTITIEFAFGMLVGWMFLKGRMPGKTGSLLILCGGAILLAASSGLSVLRLSPERCLLWRVPGALILLGAVGLENRGVVLRAPILKSLGDASYSLYLTHLFTLGFVRLVWSRLHLKTHLPDLALILVGLAVSIIAGQLVYEYVERPLVRAAQRLLPH